MEASVLSNFFVKDFKTHAIRNNFLANNCSGDLLFPINDDMVFVSKNWDLNLLETHKKYNNKGKCYK